MIRIGSIVLRVDDLQRQTEFWEAALGYVRRDSGESDDFVLLGPPDGAGPHLSLDQVRSTLQIPPRLLWGAQTRSRRRSARFAGGSSLRTLRACESEPAREN